MAAKKTISDEIFCQTYILQFDAAAAAKAAGSNAKDRRQAGYQLLEKAVVQTRIDELILERIERLRMSQDHVVLELAEITGSRGSRTRGNRVLEPARFCAMEYRHCDAHTLE